MTVAEFADALDHETQLITSHLELSSTWEIEGAVIDLIDTAEEQRVKIGTLPPGTVEELRVHLERLHRETEETLTALGASTAF